MKAIVFQLQGQEELFKDIERLLREEVYVGVEIERCVIPMRYGENSKEEVHESCRSYLRLLRACMIRVEDFRIVVGSPPYSWCYLGGDDRSKTGDLDTKQFLTIANDKLDAVFPAVAIMNRMVMVPRGFHEAFGAWSSLRFLLKPLELQGVALVNYQQLGFIREEMHQVALQLEHDIVQLCARHAEANRIGRPDLVQLSKLLDVDLTYLKQHEDVIARALIRITPSVLSGPVREGILSKVTISVEEAAGNTLKLVRVVVRGPVGALPRPVAKTLDFSKETQHTLSFDIAAKTTPFCPLEVRFESAEREQAYSAAFPAPVILDVAS